MKVSAEVDVFVKSRGRMRSLLFFPVGREVRDEVGVLGVRIVAITVVFGRRRRRDVRAWPIPVYFFLVSYMYVDG